MSLANTKTVLSHNISEGIWGFGQLHICFTHTSHPNYSYLHSVSTDQKLSCVFVLTNNSRSETQIDAIKTETDCVEFQCALCQNVSKVHV